MGFGDDCMEAEHRKWVLNTSDFRGVFSFYREYHVQGE